MGGVFVSAFSIWGFEGGVGLFRLMVWSVDISGVPGTGKTATVHAVVRELKRQAEQNVRTLLPFSHPSSLTHLVPSSPYCPLEKCHEPLNRKPTPSLTSRSTACASPSPPQPTLSSGRPFRGTTSMRTATCGFRRRRA